MSLATKRLNKQKHINFTYVWRGLALMAISIYCGIMILKDGMGTAVETGGGVNVGLRKLMAWLTARGVDADQFLLIGMVLLFVIIAIIGLFNVIRGVWQMVPAHTVLGKSIMAQRRVSEKFGDVIDSINTDMEQEPCVFGTVNIGRRWILDVEAMRLANIRGVFWSDEGMEAYTLLCVDEAHNVWGASLRYSDERDKAAEYLKKTLPDLATGDKNAYIAFLGGEPTTDGQ